MNTQCRFLFACICLCLFPLISAFGQAITGDLVVNVTDQNGGSVPKAKVELTNVGTNSVLSGETDGQGNYLFGQLKPGNYTLKAEAPGFQISEFSNIRIQLGQRARVDARLNLGAVTETVTVSAGAATLLNAESASVGQVIDEKPITELPLNGRNFVQLAQLSAGATPIGIGNSPATSWTGRGDTTLSIAGLRENNVSFLVNGIETRNSRFGSSGIRPSVDAIQEFKVQRSTFGAEFGKSAAIVNTTIRPGTRDLHLRAFDLVRNREFDANNFFANRSGREKPPFSQNNFGTTVDGPVWIPKIYNGRNRTFFMFNYEGLRQREGITSTATYPSRAQLAGNLADDSAGTGLFPTKSPFCIANPGSRKCIDIIDPESPTGASFPGNVIPTNRLDPATQKAIQYMPVANVPSNVGAGTFPTFNTFAAPKLTNDWDQYNVRIDHQITSKDLIYGSFSNSDETRIAPAIQFLGGDVFPMSNRLWTFTYNRIISPTILNEFRFGHNTSKTFRLSEGSYGQDYGREVFGLANSTTQPFDFGIPRFNITGFSATGSIPQAIGAEDENFQFTDNLSITRGKHNLRTGFQIIHQKYLQITDFNGNPTFNFDGRNTRSSSSSSNAVTTGLADFLLGFPSSVNAALGDSTQNLVTTFWGGYVQDDWHVFNNFTLNFGLRYEFAASPREIDNRALYFNPELRQVILAGQGVRPEIVDPDYNNFAPRLGFTYRPGFLKNTVIRGGAGIYYSTDNFNEEQFKVIGPPFYQSQAINGPSNFQNDTVLRMSNMLPSLTASPNVSPFTFDRFNRTPYVSQWSFDIQHSFGNDYMLEVGYAGSTGQKLPQRRNLNPAAFDPTGTIAVNPRRPYQGFGDILVTYNGGWSSYQALTTRLEKRFSKGFYILGSYTFQKALDLGATDDATTISAYFKSYDKGHTTFDVPHRFVASYIYELPFGRGKAFLSGASGLVDKLVGGWQLNGITTFSQGQFRSITINTQWMNIGGFSSNRPDYNGGDIDANRSMPDAYLNAAAFNRPRDAAGNEVHLPGNLGRNTIQMPGIANWDASLFKSTRIGERFNTQLRFEAFNLFNHTQFGASNLSLGDPNFGTINSTLVNPRRLQLGLRVTF